MAAQPDHSPIFLSLSLALSKGSEPLNQSTTKTGLIYYLVEEQWPWILAFTPAARHSWPLYGVGGWEREFTLGTAFKRLHRTRAWLVLGRVLMVEMAIMATYNGHQD